MAFIDYYKILGIPKDIAQKDVKKAYIKRARQFHPDLHPEDPKAKAKFQALNEAYDVIGNVEKRGKYDKYGERWREADAFDQNTSGKTGQRSSSQGGSPFDGFDFSSFGNGGGFSSFFQDLFGSPKRRNRKNAFQRQSTGEMNAQIHLDLYTALLGGEVVIQISSGARIKLKVKPETQNGTRVRLKGKGYDKGNGTFGDLIITYHITLPTQLSERQKSLLRQMQQG
ncbi:MAG: DnaJ domain-containing protein [Prevotellaceae bacterium]|nr:DnaJ domain-containing protein [Prevotellaceae bacterium]MDY6130677.1 DnaJ domain-containing protein [Prevotella sp.]